VAINRWPRLLSFCSQLGEEGTGKAMTDVDLGTLEIRKVAPDEVCADEPFTYEVRLANTTDRTLESITLVETLPDKFRISSAEPTPDVVQIYSCGWLLGSLRAGEQTVVRIQCTAKEGAPLHSETSVTYSS